METKTIITILVILLVVSVGYNFYQHGEINAWREISDDWSDLVNEWADYSIVWCEYSNDLIEIIKIYNPQSLLTFSECQW